MTNILSEEQLVQYICSVTLFVVQVEADLLRPAVEKENEIRAYSVFGMPSAMFSTPVSQLIQ